MSQSKMPIPVRWGRHEHQRNGAWISIGFPYCEQHFICDFLGDMKAGPAKLEDFAVRPPEWAREAAGVAA